MKLLLDTNVLLRWVGGEVMPRRVATQIEKAEELFVSIVTPWELAIKQRRDPSKKLITGNQLWTAMGQMGARILPIKREHVAQLAVLPEHHHDPFDRMIIAQGIEDKLTVVASDERFPEYKPAGLNLLWRH